MLRKTLALVIGFMIIWSVSIAGFSQYYQMNNVSDSDLEDSFEIIEPKVKVKKELYVRDNLLVSIALSESFEKYDVPVDMYLYKIEPVAALATEGFDVKGDFAIVDPLKGVNYKDLSVYNINTKSKEEIIKNYGELSRYNDYLKKNLQVVKEEIKKLNQLSGGSAPVTPGSELEKITGINEKLQKSLSEVRVLVDKARSSYNNLFEVLAYSTVRVEMDKEGLIPYFKYTYEGIEAGNYKLVFVRDDTGSAIKTVNFTVSKKEQLTEERIKEGVTDSLNILPKN